MVRAGAVDHPLKWAHSGYREIQESPKRYSVIDSRISYVTGFLNLADFQQAHCE
jgi:hypothetical protein